MAETNTVTIVGCGYIGKRLAKRLLHDGNKVTGIVRNKASLAACTNQDIPCMSVDLDHLQQDINLSGQRLAYLAPPPRKGRVDSRMFAFLEAIADQPPERFVLISTTGVYGDRAGAWINEDTPLKPKADRAFRRADAERQVTYFCTQKNIPLVILRVAGIYGPGKLPVDRLRSGEPIVNEQDSPFTNRVHADDLAKICELALLQNNIDGIYNVTDGQPGTMYQYFNQVAIAMMLPPPSSISLEEAQGRLSQGMLSYMAESRRISNEKLLRDFNLELQYPTLHKGLEQCLQETES